MKGSLAFLVLALISYSLSSPIQSDEEDENALFESLFTEDRDTGFDDDRSPKETSDLTALEAILDTEDLPRKKVEKLSKARHQGTLKEALYKDEARDESNAMSKEEGKANGIPIDVLADYESRPKEDESSNGESAGIPIPNDEPTHKEQGHRRQDERRTSAGETPLNNNPTRTFANSTPSLLTDYEELPKEYESSLREIAGVNITNDEATQKEQNHAKDERRTSADYEERPKEDESSNGEFAGIPIPNDESTLKEQGYRRQYGRRPSADYEERPKEDESSNEEFAGIRIDNDEATHKEQGHRRQDERRTSAATLENFVADSSVSDLFEEPSGSDEGNVDG